MEYNILVVDDNPGIARLFKEGVEKAGHKPIICTTSEEAIHCLTQEHQSLALVLCDYRLEGAITAEPVLSAKNHFDRFLPFYLASGVAQADEVEPMARGGVDGYYEKSNAIAEDICALVNTILVERVSLKKTPVMFKIGGSADDYDTETGASQRALLETLNYFVSLQQTGKYQVVLTTGAGKRGDNLKQRLRKYESLCPDFVRFFPHKMLVALEENQRDWVDLMGADNATMITPDHMTGRSPYKSLGFNSWRDINPSALFNQDKVLVLGSAPRHLGLARYPTGEESYAHVPLQDSDAQTLLLAELLGVRTLGLLKRTDNIYRFDPRSGLGTGGFGQFTWRTSHEENEALHRVSAQELLNRCTRTEKEVLRVGAEDHKDGHLFEDSGLQLFELSEVVQEIGIACIDPDEFFTNSGRHVVTKEEKPEITARQRREAQIMSIIEGGNFPRITHSK